LTPCNAALTSDLPTHLDLFTYHSATQPTLPFHTKMPGESQEIVAKLKDVLHELTSHPYPHVPTPEGCNRRASVAVIIRIRPVFSPVLQSDASVVHIEPNEPAATSLEDFLSRQWVQDGDPEVLFIKRSGRAGDKWSGHIALPGGKRDPEDESDLAVAIRETREEVGLDLAASDCLPAGSLPERVVASRGGRQALMVLCPYVFLYTSNNVPRVLPQPTEVASAHWVPLRALLSSNLRTREYVDTASRMVERGGSVAKALLRMTIGEMVFSAIRLAPSESIFASSIPGFIPEAGESHLEGFLEGAFGITPAGKKKGLTYQQPLLLWGLTLGVLADFLDMLPPYNAVELWKYPTFTVPDLRLLVWLFTRGQRKNNASNLSGGTWGHAKPSQTAVDATTAAVAVTEPDLDGLGESGRGRAAIGDLGDKPKTQDAASELLAGYYERINTAVVVFVAYRSVVGSAAVYWLYKLWFKRRAAT
jgi:8-oxo-dGTP pyrophosphatase MutT (NUDIX family)